MTVPYFDKRFGNVWSNIDLETFKKLKPKQGDRFHVVIKNEDSVAYEGNLPFFDTFGQVERGEALIFINSRLFVSIAIREGHFASAHGIGTGPKWTFTCSRK
jgi:S-adenosylmethionine hydrolase